jgi:hypothetical protein
LYKTPQRYKNNGSTDLTGSSTCGEGNIAFQASFTGKKFLLRTGLLFTLKRYFHLFANDLF